MNVGIKNLLFFHLAALKSLAVPIAIGKASPTFFAPACSPARWQAGCELKKIAAPYLPARQASLASRISQILCCWTITPYFAVWQTRREGQIPENFFNFSVNI